METKQHYIDEVRTVCTNAIAYHQAYAKREIKLPDTDMKRIALELIKAKVGLDDIFPLLNGLVSDCLICDFCTRKEFVQGMQQAYRLARTLANKYEPWQEIHYADHVTHAFQHEINTGNRNVKDVQYGIRYALQRRHIKSYCDQLKACIQSFKPTPQRQVDLDLDVFTSIALGHFLLYWDSNKMKFSENSPITTITYILAEASGLICNKRYLGNRLKQQYELLFPTPGR